MCGIAGFVAPPGVLVDRGVLEGMVGTLAHRGPDTFGYRLDGPAALGIARLRVIDLVTGDQPISNEDGAVSVILNGEIYGYGALRADLERAGHRSPPASDTEVIVTPGRSTASIVSITSMACSASPCGTAAATSCFSP